MSQVPDSPTAGRDARRLRDTLARAVRDGIITGDQADAIVASESADRGARTSGVPVYVEGLAYLGGLLLMVGSAILVGQFWDDLSTWSRITLFAVLAVVLSASGRVIPEERDPALERLAWFLWALGSGALAVALGLVGADVLDFAPETVAILVGGPVALHAGVRWGLADRPLQHLTCLGGLVAATVGTAAALDGEPLVTAAVWLLGAGWLGVGWRGILPPRPVALLAGATLVLVAPGVLGDWSPGAASALGLASSWSMLGWGIRRREFLLTLGGALGTFIYLPMAVGHFLGESIAVPLAIVLSGAVLLGLAVRAIRHGRAPDVELVDTEGN